MNCVERVSEIKKTIGMFVIPKNPLKTVVYDFNGTLAVNVQTESLALYTQKLFDAIEPLTKLSDEELPLLLEQKGIKISGKNISLQLRDFLVETVRKPSRGTKAREVYYDLIEIALEKKEIQVEVLADSIAKNSTLDREKAQGYSLVAFSRGTQSMLDKLLAASGLSSLIEEIYSSIDYGGEKRAEAYVGMYARLLSQGRIPIRFYDDEFDIINEIMLFRLALPSNAPSFDVVWVDRKNEYQTKQKELRELEASAKKFLPGKKFSDLLVIKRTLLE